jgi:hypothetical protein
MIIAFKNKIINIPTLNENLIIMLNNYAISQIGYKNTMQHIKTKYNKEDN